LKSSFSLSSRVNHDLGGESGRTLGEIVIVGGWILTVGALTAAVLRPHGVVADNDRWYTDPQIVLTLACAAGAAIAASVFAGMAVSWVALLWFTTMHRRNIA
jgi:hypothetical protein